VTETKDDEEKNVAEVGRGERDEGRGDARDGEELGTVRCESRQIRGESSGAAAHLYVRGADDLRDSKTRRTIDAPRR